SALQSGLSGGSGLSDAFVFKLGSGGSTLVYSTYFGGPDIDYANAIAVDGGGNAYITGGTASGAQFPRQTPFQNNAGGLLDAFVAKINPAGIVLEGGLPGELRTRRRPARDVSIATSVHGD